jgi:hypothetical protein
MNFKILIGLTVFCGVFNSIAANISLEEPDVDIDNTDRSQKTKLAERQIEEVAPEPVELSSKPEEIEMNQDVRGYRHHQYRQLRPYIPSVETAPEKIAQPQPVESSPSQVMVIGGTTRNPLRRRLIRY